MIILLDLLFTDIATIKGGNELDFEDFKALCTYYDLDDAKENKGLNEESINFLY